MNYATYSMEEEWRDGESANTMLGSLASDLRLIYFSEGAAAVALVSSCDRSFFSNLPYGVC